MTSRKIVAAAVVVAILGATVPASANFVDLVLTNGNSTVRVDPYSSEGVYEWTIGKTSHLAQQWFWLRSDLDGLDDREYSLDEFDPTPVVSQPLPNVGIITYSDGRLEIEVTYVLVSGPGLFAADLAEVIKITNLSEEDEVFLDFFQYSDFDLNGTEDDDTVVITGGNRAYQTDGGSAATFSETVVSQSPDLSEVALHPDTLDKLEDGHIDDLDGSTGPLGPDDVTWAFQWDNRIIQPEEALTISKDKVLISNPIAEPSAVLLLAGGLLGTYKRRKRR